MADKRVELKKITDLITGNEANQLFDGSDFQTRQGQKPLFGKTSYDVIKAVAPLTTLCLKFMPTRRAQSLASNAVSLGSARPSGLLISCSALPQRNKVRTLQTCCRSYWCSQICLETELKAAKTLRETRIGK